MEVKEVIEFLESSLIVNDKLPEDESTTNKVNKTIALLKQSDKYQQIIEEVKEEIKDWLKIAESDKTPKLSGEGFEKGWKLAINRVCNSITDKLE